MAQGTRPIAVRDDSAALGSAGRAPVPVLGGGAVPCYGFPRSERADEAREDHSSGWRNRQTR